MTSVVRRQGGEISVSVNTLEKIRSYLQGAGFSEGARLPPERELAERLDMSRGALRQALAVLESSGEIWRHVGKGTFLGQQHPQTEDALARNLARQSNPVEVIEARLVLESKLAALAAIRGSEKSFSGIACLIEDGRAQRTAAQSQKMGDEFHHAVARAAGSSLLLALFESVFRVRGLTSWGRLRPAIATLEELSHVWDEHEEIFEAIRSRDAHEAARRMHMHIESIQKRIALGHEILNVPSQLS